MKYLFLFLVFTGMAQKKDTWDTLKYQKFHSNLIIGVFQSYRNFNNNFQQFKVPDTAGVSENHFYAESNNIAGIEVNYDKFNFSLGLKSTPQDLSAGKGDTKTFNTNLNFGGNIWYLENSFRYFRGFYDVNTPRYDTTFSETGKYYQQPGMTNVLFRSKFMYFLNHNQFAFRAGYACNYRQLKSAASWVFSSNLSLYDLRNDSSFFPPHARQYYGNYGGMKGLGVFAFSMHWGGAATLVIRKGFFMSVLFVVGPEQQWRNYSYTDGQTQLSYLSVSGNLRGSLGFNLKRCYFLSTSSNDFTVYNNSFVGLTNKSLSGGITFGWRFNSKTPEFYKKFQNSNFYQSI